MTREEQIFAELQKFALPDKQPGDMSIREVMAAFGCKAMRATGIMERAAQTGGYEILRVFDPEIGKEVKVLRKK